MKHISILIIFTSALFIKPCYAGGDLAELTDAVVHQKHSKLQELCDRLKFTPVLNAQDKEGKSLLFHAVGHNNPEAVSLLLAAGADYYIPDRVANFPLEVCVLNYYATLKNLLPKDLSTNKDQELSDAHVMLEIMLSENNYQEEQSNQNSPGTIAAAWPWPRIMRALIDLEKLGTSTVDREQTAKPRAVFRQLYLCQTYVPQLKQAILAHNLSTVAGVLACYPHLITARDGWPDGTYDTLLHLSIRACKNPDMITSTRSLILCLLMHDATLINRTNTDGQAPVMLALALGKLYLVNLLVTIAYTLSPVTSAGTIS